MKEKDQFEEWLFIMDDRLSDFIESLPENIKNEMDYSADSLDIIERWLLSLFSKSETILEEKNKFFLDGLSRYIGETYRKQLTGKWSINIDDPEFVFYGLPIITDSEKNETIICPISMSTTTIVRNQGTFLSTILKNHMS